MATQKQIEANHRNAQKSTGPKTEQGKETVRRNAVKHGLLAKNVLVLPGEQDEYDRFTQEMEKDMAPKGALERALVKRMTDLLWQSMRTPKIESGILIDALLQQDHRPRQTGPSEEEQQLEAQNPDALRLGRAYKSTSPVLAALARYRVKLDREFYRTLEQFRIAYYARTHRHDTFWVANLKKFAPEPEKWEQLQRRIGDGEK